MTWSAHVLYSFDPILGAYENDSKFNLQPRGFPGFVGTVRSEFKLCDLQTAAKAMCYHLYFAGSLHCGTIHRGAAGLIDLSCFMRFKGYLLLVNLIACYSSTTHQRNSQLDCWIIILLLSNSCLGSAL